MKKFLLLTLVIFFALIQFSFAEGRIKVAVLDATIGNGVEENASAIVADTINEQFVKSDGYIAIDRAYISKIQAEKKFQLSGEVNSDDVKELGAIFGAQFICIANVSKLGSTYTVSARMIDVETAQVVSQESAKQKGEIDVLFDIAEVVGNKLVGKKYDAAEEPAPVKEKETSVVKETPKTSAVSAAKKKARSRITIGYMFPGYFGNDNNPAMYDMFDLLYNSDSQSFYEASNDTWYTAYSGWKDSMGLDIESIFSYNLWYISAGLSYTEQVVGYTDSTYTDNEFTNFYTIEPYASIGAIFSMIKNLQVYGGISIGYLMLGLGDYWPNEDDSASGFAFGIETGVDYFIGNLCINAAYKLSYSPDLTGENIFTDSAVETSGFDSSFGTSGLVLSVGYGF